MSLPPLIVPPSFHSTSIVGGRGDGGCGGGGGGEGGGSGGSGGGGGRHTFEKCTDVRW